MDVDDSGKASTDCVKAGYLQLLHNGVLASRVEAAYTHLRACDLCAGHCLADRLGGQLGFCKTADKARVASYFPHFGEESCLRGWCGSGAIFFGRCNMRCQYCQNYDVSIEGAGLDLEPEQIAAVMLELQALGVHNINLVSPSHVIAPILAAVYIAAQKGLYLPLVYNTGGFDSLEGLALLDGVVDIYMPDMKYSDAAIAHRYSKIHGYPEANRAAIREMHRQVGNLVHDHNGLAQRGLLVRHLVLPGGLAGTESIMHFLAEEISRDTYVNIMDQYRPAYRATLGEMGPLSRRVNHHEVEAAYQIARDVGLYRFDHEAVLSNMPPARSNCY